MHPGQRDISWRTAGRPWRTAFILLPCLTDEIASLLFPPLRRHQEAIRVKCFPVTLGSKALFTCLWDTLEGSGSISNGGGGGGGRGWSLKGLDWSAVDCFCNEATTCGSIIPWCDLPSNPAVKVHAAERAQRLIGKTNTILKTLLFLKLQWETFLGFH